MNSRERVILILNNQKPDRLAFNFWMDRDLMIELDKKLGENFRVSHYDADIIETFAIINWFPDFSGKAEIINDEKTTWTIKHAVSSVEELVGAAYPDSENPIIYEYIKNDRKRYPDKALFALMITPLEILFDKVGMEQFFYDLVDYEDIVDDVILKLSLVLEKIVDKVCDCDIDVIYLAGDICSTKGSILSNEMLSRYCFNPIRKVVEKAHSKGKKVFYHTDGYVMDILDLIVDCGIDGINPLQVSANNDLNVFRNRYSDKLMVYGGIDNCFIIPDGTVQDVENHIKDIFKTLGSNGRFITSSHDIPSKVPLENVDAMVRTIKECSY